MSKLNPRNGLEPEDRTSDGEVSESPPQDDVAKDSADTPMGASFGLRKDGPVFKVPDEERASFRKFLQRDLNR